MKPRIVRLEVHHEPGFQFSGETLAFSLSVVAIPFHEVAEEIEQALMVGLVYGRLLVASLLHEALLQCEVSGDPTQQVPESRFNLILRTS